MTDRKSIGHYEIDSELGRGGMGVVYKAFDPTLNRQVAIKVLSESLAHDESVVERFVREAKSMAALNDAHIVQIYSIGEEAGKPFFVMEFVDGEPLGARLKRDGKLPVAEARRIIAETCIGLQAAHDRGVIHRDIKPGNLMLTASGKVKIADFGIAMVQDFSKRLTNTGEFVGTPGYLSPEVCMGQEVDHRSDIFALGIVFFEMLTGNIPFTESSPLGMMLEVVNADIPDVRTLNAAVDDDTCRILRRMIAKSPGDRYQSCSEIRSALDGGAPAAAVAPPAPDSSAAATVVSQPNAQRPGTADSSAAATVVSQPNAPMPPPQPQSATPSASLSQARGDLVPTRTKRRSGLFTAFAALLVLLGGAGALYAFRDRLLGDREQPEPRIALAAAREPVAQPDDATESTGADAGGPAAAIANTGAPSAEAADATGDGNAIERLAATGPADPPAPARESPATGPAGGSTPVETLSFDRSKRLAVDPEPTPAGPADAAPSLAKVVPRGEETALPDPTPLPPREPRIVVLGVGDPAIAGPVVGLLEDALATQRGLQLMDAAFVPGIDRVAGAGGVDLPGLARLLTSNGADVLVLAEIDFLGETPLQYYGRFDTLYTVNVKVRSILLEERRPLGRGWQHQVQFTTLNAGEKAREAVDPYLADLKAQLGEIRG